MKALLVLLGTLFMSVNLYASNLIVNGDFEQPQLSGTNNWVTYYGQNGYGDTCPAGNAPNNCSDLTLVPGWSAWWVSSVLDPDLVGLPAPGRIEIQRGNVGGVLPHGGDQKVELDTHHNDDGSGNNNIVLFQFVPVCKGNSYTLDYAWKSRTETPNDNDINVIVDDIITGSGTAVNGHTLNDAWEMGQVQFVASDWYVPVAFWSFGMNNTLGMYLDDISLTVDDPEAPCSLDACTSGKPQTITMQYTATSGSNNSQDEDYADPEVGVDFPNPALIAVLDGRKSKPPIGIGTFNKDELFSWNTDRTLKNGKVKDGKVPPRTVFLIIDPETQDVVQTIEVHTSCSQPLNVHDQFGGLTVRGFNQ